MTTCATRTRPARGRDRAQELRGQIGIDLDRLAKAVDSVRESETFRRFLDVQAKFHRYSWHNTMLIASQRPDATRVAGFKKWKELGRHVCKGERGIAILAPCPFKRTVTTEAGEEETLQGLFFKVVHVFDVAQTDGQPLPDVDVPDVQTAADALLARLERVATKRGIGVAFTDLESGHYGLSKGGAIDLANGHATGQQALISHLEAAPELAPVWEPTLREAIADLMEEIYRCQDKQEKIRMAALEYRARLILQRIRLREAN